MAITINTRPLEHDNHAIFDVSTSLVASASIVNPRVESSLMIGAEVFAKKSKPKALTTHDYTEILRSLIKWTTPNPLDDSGVTKFIEGGKTGSNLITGWTNYLGAFTTWSSAGPIIITASKVGAGGVASSNNIAVTKGKIYVVIMRSGTVTATNNLQEVVTGLGCNVIGLTASVTEFKYYIQPRATGNINIGISHTAGTGGVTGSFEMYELNTCDWWQPYYMKFQEKWEDASGVTQSGTATTDTYLLNYFDSPSLTSTEFQDYLMTGSTSKFLAKRAFENKNPTGIYSGTNYQNSLMVCNNPPSGQSLSHFIPFILPSTVNNVKADINCYNEAGTSLGVSANPVATQYIYHPIAVLFISNLANYYSAAYRFRATTTLQKNGSGQISEELHTILDTRSFHPFVPLVWRNDKGGFSTKVFANELKVTRRVKREQYKDSTNLKRTHFSEKVNACQVVGFMTSSKDQLAYLADIVDAPDAYRYTSTGVFTPINIVTESVPIEDMGIIPQTIEFEYIP